MTDRSTSSSKTLIVAGIVASVAAVAIAIWASPRVHSQSPVAATSFSEEFQKLMGEDGWVPGNTKYGDAISGPFGDISATIVENSKLTPNTPQWGVAAGNNLLRDFFTTIAQGKDVEASTTDYGAQLEDILNTN